jgi:hypothetical protein
MKSPQPRPFTFPGRPIRYPIPTPESTPKETLSHRSELPIGDSLLEMVKVAENRSIDLDAQVALTTSVWPVPPKRKIALHAPE